MQQSIKGNIVDIRGRRIFFGELIQEAGKIKELVQLAGEADPVAPFICPGFIDAHVHIESSMLVPTGFARLAVVHGTVGTISDPHEIANVLGIAGVEFMIENGRQCRFKFHFGAPSCVPATVFETAGSAIDAAEVHELLKRPEIHYLSEMMNFPGVLAGDVEVMEKIAAAHSLGKPVDGHAPGLRGDAAARYIAAGISTDHECFTAEEALDKLQRGMKILIREGSAAKNFEALIPLLQKHAHKMMFCSDDKHPDSLAASHINELCARAVAKGVDPFNVLLAACINPVLHYKMNVGILQPGDPADFILLENLRDFKVLQTWIDGEIVAAEGISKIPHIPCKPVNRFHCQPHSAKDYFIPVTDLPLPAIQALDGQLITNRIAIRKEDLLIQDGGFSANTNLDLLKIAVVNRYKPAPVACCFVRGFNIKSGAIASSVAHDSHNIIVVGADDDSMAEAVNLVIEAGGGISCAGPEASAILALPVAGLMSNEEGYEVAASYTNIDKMAKELGSALSAPFMTLSFMALLVIPELKLSDLGLFDGTRFEFVR